MKNNYKNDIIEKVIEYFAAIYLVFGLIMTYSWACTQLDQLASNAEISSFWNSLAFVTGFLKVLHIVFIIYCIYKNHKYVKGQSIVNDESSLIFNCILYPLYLATIIYLCWQCVSEYYSTQDSWMIHEVIILLEIIFISFIFSLMQNLSFSRNNVCNSFHYIMNNLVLLITLIGFFNYIFFHYICQQITTFIKVATNNSKYDKRYFHSNIKDITHFEKAQQFLQPLVIIFYCCAICYIIPLMIANKKEYLFNNNYNILEKNQNEECKNITILELPKRKFKTLTPISLLIGFVFFTVIFTMFAIVISLTAGINLTLQLLGEKIISIFPIPICILSIPLLILQINSMRSWSKLTKNKNLVHKILLWIGAGGLLIVAVTEIKSHTYISNYQYSYLIVLLFMSLILNCFFQTITISLALDREWSAPKIKSLQSYLRPNFALFCINLAFFAMAVYSCRNKNSIANYHMNVQTRSFIRFFNEGFYSIGVTLVLITRLHSVIIFAKMTLIV